MNPEILYRITGGCWILLIATWLFASLFTKTTAYKVSRKTRARYFVILLCGAWLVARSATFPAPFNLLLWGRATGVAAVGAGCCVLGTLFALWARAVLGRNWSGAVTLKEDHQLVERGPYAVVRHPIYTGMLSMLIGTVLQAGTLGSVMGFFVIVVGLWSKLLQEEQVMLSAFGDQYVDYAGRVRRLIPFLF